MAGKDRERDRRKTDGEGQQTASGLSLQCRGADRLLRQCIMGSDCNRDPVVQDSIPPQNLIPSDPKTLFYGNTMKCPLRHYKTAHMIYAVLSMTTLVWCCHCASHNIHPALISDVQVDVAIVIWMCKVSAVICFQLFCLHKNSLLHYIANWYLSYFNLLT